MKIFPGSSTLEMFPGTGNSKIEKHLKYATSDFTGISKSTSIKKVAFLKALGLGNADKVLSCVLEPLLLRAYKVWCKVNKAFQYLLFHKILKLAL